jgi:hypothetical protein
MVISSCLALLLGLAAMVAIVIFIIFAGDIVKHLKRQVSFSIPRPVRWKLAYATVILVLAFFVIQAGVTVKPCGKDKTLACNCITGTR